MLHEQRGVRARTLRRTLEAWARDAAWRAIAVGLAATASAAIANGVRSTCAAVMRRWSERLRCHAVVHQAQRVACRHCDRREQHMWRDAWHAWRSHRADAHRLSLRRESQLRYALLQWETVHHRRRARMWRAADSLAHAVTASCLRRWAAAAAALRLGSSLAAAVHDARTRQRVRTAFAAWRLCPRRTPARDHVLALIMRTLIASVRRVMARWVVAASVRFATAQRAHLAAQLARLCAARRGLRAWRGATSAAESLSAAVLRNSRLQQSFLLWIEWAHLVHLNIATARRAAAAAAAAAVLRRTTCSPLRDAWRHWRRCARPKQRLEAAAGKAVRASLLRRRLRSFVVRWREIARGRRAHAMAAIWGADSAARTSLSRWRVWLRARRGGGGGGGVASGRRGVAAAR